MKRIRRSRAARLVSVLLTVAMVAPMIRCIASPGAALAQGAVGGTQQTAIRVDFENRSGVQGVHLSRLVTDAVANGLEATGQYLFASSRDVVREATDLGLRPPYDRLALAKIANRIGATTIVTGEITRVRAVGTGAARVMQAWVRVRVLEASSGESLNGAAQIGEALARPGQDDDSLVQEAARNAATLCVQQIMQSTLPEGIVLNIVATRPGDVQVLVNRGSRDGVRQGMEMIVFRARERVGRLRITGVMTTDSEAAVLENIQGIRPEDRVRAIFPDPPFPAEPGRPVRRPTTTAMRTLGNLALVLLTGAAIWAAVGGGSTSTVTGVIAEADIENRGPAVRLRWRDNLFAGQTLEYQVWRDPDVAFNPLGVPVAAVGAPVRTYTDYPAPFTFWVGERGFLRPAEDTGDAGAGAASRETPDDDNRTFGFATGRTTSYSINSVLRRPLGQAAGGGVGGGGTATFADIYSGVVTSGPVTPMLQPQLGATPADGASNVDIAQFNPTWLSVAGADVFVVEVSPDRMFTNRSAILQIGPVFSTSSAASGVPQVLSAPVNLGTNPVLLRHPAFRDYMQRGGPKPTLFWRVGGRNNADRPGPVHWITRNPSDQDRTFRFIYSDVRSFQPADMPPPPP
ncbi:MAG TPA: hypothetical protein VLH79_11160 [Chthonomonadales bacterium]|nr:hypothetical protein [Chthonomonadales bacterium]